MIGAVFEAMSQPGPLQPAETLKRRRGAPHGGLGILSEVGPIVVPGRLVAGRGLCAARPLALGILQSESRAGRF